MSKRRRTKRRPPSARPWPRLDDHVRDEAIHIPKGDTRYTIDLDQATVDALEGGTCPEALANRMHALMAWRRAAIRATTERR